MGPQAASTQAHEHHGHLSLRSRLSQADPSRIPMNGMPGPQSNYLAKRTTKSHGHTPKGSNLGKKESPSTSWATKEAGPQSPLFRKNLQRCILLLYRLGGYTHRVRSRAPTGKSKNPQSNSTRIARGLGGYCQGPILGYPKRRS